MEQLIDALDSFTKEISSAMSGPYADIKAGGSWGSLVILAVAIILGYIFSSYFSEFFRERLRRKRQSAYLIGYCRAVARHAKANLKVIEAVIEDIENIYRTEHLGFPAVSYFDNIKLGERYYFTSEGEADKSYFEPYIATELMRLELIIRNADNEVSELVNRAYLSDDIIPRQEYKSRLLELNSRIKQIHKECAKMELRIVGVEAKRSLLPSWFWIPKKNIFYFINYLTCFVLIVSVFFLGEEILKAMLGFYDTLRSINVLQLLAVIGGVGLVAVFAIDGFFHDRVAAWRLTNQNNFLEHLETRVKEIDRLLSSDNNGKNSSESAGANRKNYFFENYPPTHVASTITHVESAIKKFEIKVRQPVEPSQKRSSPQRSRKSS
jgi:hypothetical protein